MENAKKLLKRLTELVPPKDNQHHNITLVDNKLMVCLMTGKAMLPFTIHDDELNRTADDLANEIYHLMCANGMSMKEG